MATLGGEGRDLWGFVFLEGAIYFPTSSKLSRVGIYYFLKIKDP